MTAPLRPRRAFWGDVRFLVGIALIVLSITGVWFLVSAVDRATPVLQASRTITTGEVLDSDDFQVVDVALGAVTAQYVAPQDLQAGQVASRTIAKGEIVPAAALTDAATTGTTTIVVESSTGVPEEVAAGTVVEIWHAPPLADGRSFDAPRILVADAVVHTVQEADGMLADTGSEVEVVIDRADVADVLTAVTGGSSLSVVPVQAGP